ncbi:MAG: zinc ribbon domain-containing protein [Eubacteriales bacterium]|nr:zinc ribbon domain-containing protein [Eubacteriales bacterium]
MFCPNCGAEFADWAHKCPYCGTVNDQVDEELYMAHMEELRQRLDHVDEDAEEHYVQNVTGSVKRIFVIVGIILAAALALVILIRVLETRSEEKTEKYYKDLYVWQKEVFPELDALYAQGDYEGVMEAAAKATENTEFYAGDWKHYYFVFTFYDAYRNMMQMEEARKNGTCDSTTLGMGLYGAVYLYCCADDTYLEELRTAFDANNDSYGITEEEQEKIREYREAAGPVLHDTIGWTDEDIESIYKEAASGEHGLLLGPFFDKADAMEKEAGR